MVPEPSPESPGIYVELSDPAGPHPTMRLVTTLFPLGVRAGDDAAPGTGTVTYAADLLFASPSFLQVTNPRLPVHDGGRLGAVRLGADWLLAALAVDDGAAVPTTRPFARILAARVRRALARPPAGAPDDGTAFYADATAAGQVAVFAGLQAGSLVGYDYAGLTDAQARAGAAAGNATQPVLARNVHFLAWAYGLHHRTTVFGVVVAVLGGLVVLARTALKVATGAEEAGAMELLVAALQHVPEDEKREQLETMAGTEVAKFRWRGVRTGRGKDADVKRSHEAAGPESPLSLEEAKS